VDTTQGRPGRGRAALQLGTALVALGWDEFAAKRTSIEVSESSTIGGNHVDVAEPGTVGSL
jgi:hypothetical protein